IAKKTSLTVKKLWQENDVLIENNLTQNFSPVTVHLKRKIQNTLDSNFDQLIQLTYNEDSTKSWQAKVADLPINDSTNQAYIYFIEEDTKEIEPFYLKDYINNNITLSFNEDENKIEVINEKQTAKINIIKNGLTYMEMKLIIRIYLK
ncbi:Cna B-type domain-containing protein, partial [Enterococcus cecorum]|uniref:Cna B-type domain-containing protein n=1 Tax=Enterococcus cecorum TaxID=44008 RepID=UPI001FABDAC5